MQDFPTRSPESLDADNETRKGTREVAKGVRHEKIRHKFACTKKSKACHRKEYHKEKIRSKERFITGSERSKTHVICQPYNNFIVARNRKIVKTKTGEKQKRQEERVYIISCFKPQLSCDEQRDGRSHSDLCLCCQTRRVGDQQEAPADRCFSESWLMHWFRFASQAQ